MAGDKTVKSRKNAGYSLVELIVVIAIIVVLMSVLIPGVVGYIKTASRLSAINTVRVMVTTMEVSMLEHSMEKKVIIDKLYKDRSSNQFIDAGYLTNYMLARAQRNENYSKSNNDYADFLIAKDILEAVKSGPGEPHPVLKFTKDVRPTGKTIKTFCNDDSDAAVFVYAPEGGVLYAQVAIKNTWLVTYEDSAYSAVEIKSNTKMVGNEKIKDN